MSSAYERLPIAEPGRTRADALALARPRWLAATAAGTLTVATAAGLAVPAILGRIVDLVSEQGADARITGAAALLLAAAVVQGALTAVGQALIGVGHAGRRGVHPKRFERAMLGWASSTSPRCAAADGVAAN